jgi:aminoglycoside phosphotransferase (APT) family kinase protein
VWEPRLTQRHADVLLEFAQDAGATRADYQLEQLRNRIAALRGLVDEARGDMLRRTIEAIRTMPDVGHLPNALAHGDFAPWNVRFDRRTRRLAIFDWEQDR